jgi:hypothetical protein
MRYRIQIESLLDAVICVVTTYEEYGRTMHSRSRLYTLGADEYKSPDLVEILGELQRMIGESQG